MRVRTRLRNKGLGKEFDMSDFAIAQEQYDFIERVARGEKVVYHHRMYTLSVFADNFVADARGPNWTCKPLTSLHYVDLLLSHENLPRTVGVQFWSAQPVIERVHASGKTPSAWTAGFFLERCLEYTSTDHEKLRAGIEELNPVVGHVIIPETVILEILDLPME